MSVRLCQSGFEAECKQFGQVDVINQSRMFHIHARADIAVKFPEDYDWNYSLSQDIWEQIKVSVEKVDTAERLAS